MNITTITLDDVLEAKDAKALSQSELLQKYKCTVIGLAVNMPGNIKKTPVIISLLDFAKEQLCLQLKRQQINVLEIRKCFIVGGPYIALAVSADARTVKNIAITLEEAAHYCRLLDIDVYSSNGVQISRSDLQLPPRVCLICSQPAVLCVRNRTHTFETLKQTSDRLLCSFLAMNCRTLPKAIESIASLAVTSMLLEAICTPAPGLVDRDNSGAHQDMDIFSFMQSSSALTATMQACALAGYNHNAPPAQLLPILRLIGLQGEQDMFDATGGVNTQKGLIFLLGILTAAAGISIQSSSTLASTKVISIAAQICSGITQELHNLKHEMPQRKLTAGEDFYLKYGVTGIRGEIENALPAITLAGLPTLKHALHQGLSINDALVHTLFAIMAHTQDTTILHRSNVATLQEVQNDAKNILATGGMYTEHGRHLIKQLDKKYIQKNISPGGSADLLAATYFLYKLESLN